ncbi:hypothetical protein R7E51_22670, partial [Vibrio sp. Vb1166]|uniref:hypothetical protein n=1 Tax=Vibrio sp. Vb1166 TaxID=3074640 RepID=UPI002964C90F
KSTASAIAYVEPNAIAHPRTKGRNIFHFSIYSAEFCVGFIHPNNLRHKRRKTSLVEYFRVAV